MFAGGPFYDFAKIDQSSVLLSGKTLQVGAEIKHSVENIRKSWENEGIIGPHYMAKSEKTKSLPILQCKEAGEVTTPLSLHVFYSQRTAVRLGIQGYIVDSRHQGISFLAEC